MPITIEESEEFKRQFIEGKLDLTSETTKRVEDFLFNWLRNNEHKCYESMLNFMEVFMPIFGCYETLYHGGVSMEDKDIALELHKPTSFSNYKNVSLHFAGINNEDYDSERAKINFARRYLVTLTDQQAFSLDDFMLEYVEMRERSDIVEEMESYIWENEKIVILSEDSNISIQYDFSEYDEYVENY